MKKFIAMLLILSMAFSITTYASDPNIDGGGGGTEEGTGENFWSIGNDGIRVTIVRESNKKAVTEPVDFTNVDASDTLYG